MRLLRPITLALVASCAPLVLTAQGRGGGEPPKNLQVLPKDMTRGQVTAVMRQFAMALGVRCEHCHAEAPAAATADAAPAGGRGGRGGGPNLDYALDDKETKKVAREMIRMVMDINGKYLPTTGRTITDFNRVTCETCHHGLAKPRTLRAAMTEAVQANGPDSAVALYRALRLRYFGSAAYDFSEQSLNETGNQLGQNADSRKAAIAILKLNLEFFPQSVPTLQNLANVSVASGDTAAAIDALNKALAIQPQNNQLRNMLQRLRPGS
ncbi:MAG TPA: c-type cytochrome [Gemmatimonadaceae bacterium]